MNYNEYSVLAVIVSNYIYEHSSTSEILDFIKFFDLINHNLKFLYCGEKDIMKDK